MRRCRLIAAVVILGVAWGLREAGITIAHAADKHWLDAMW